MTTCLQERKHQPLAITLGNLRILATQLAQAHRKVAEHEASVAHPLSVSKWPLGSQLREERDALAARLRSALITCFNPGDFHLAHALLVALAEQHIRINTMESRNAFNNRAGHRATHSQREVVDANARYEALTQMLLSMLQSQ